MNEPKSWYVERTDTHEREPFTAYPDALRAYDALIDHVVLCRGDGTVIDCK